MREVAYMKLICWLSASRHKLELKFFVYLGPLSSSSPKFLLLTPFVFVFLFLFLSPFLILFHFLFQFLFFFLFLCSCFSWQPTRREEEEEMFELSQSRSFAASIALLSPSSNFNLNLNYPPGCLCCSQRLMFCVSILASVCPGSASKLAPIHLKLEAREASFPSLPILTSTSLLFFNLFCEICAFSAQLQARYI